MYPTIIVGSGLAGFTLAREWRKLDADSPLLMVTTEDGYFYSKPMLSNALAGGKTAQQLINKPAAQMEQELKITIMARARVSAIDSARHTLTVDGQDIEYARLVLALGADPFRPPMAGNAADEVLSVNDLDDYARFRDKLAGIKRMAILGAGLIGCEFANDLLSADIRIDVIDPGSRPLGALLPPEASRHLQQSLADLGVNWHFGIKAEQVNRTEQGLQLGFSDGASLNTDLVLSAVGLRARTALASAAGIQVNRGILVNDQLQTSTPDIYAIGDCAEAQGKVLPFVMPLMQQARTLAKTLTGAEASLSYPVMPVVIKTPACPIVVCPPNQGSEGEWQEEATGQGVRARFFGQDKKLLGFALTGKLMAEKNTLVQQMAEAG